MDMGFSNPQRGLDVSQVSIPHHVRCFSCSSYFVPFLSVSPVMIMKDDLFSAVSLWHAAPRHIKVYFPSVFVYLKSHPPYFSFLQHEAKRAGLLIFPQPLLGVPVLLARTSPYINSPPLTAGLSIL